LLRNLHCGCQHRSIVISASRITGQEDEDAKDSASALLVTFCGRHVVCIVDCP